MEEQAEPEIVDCPECDGRGWTVEYRVGMNNNVWDDSILCEDCQGTGLHPIPLSEFTYWGLKRYPQA